MHSLQIALPASEWEANMTCTAVNVADLNAIFHDFPSQLNFMPIQAWKTKDFPGFYDPYES